MESRVRATEFSLAAITTYLFARERHKDNLLPLVAKYRDLQAADTEAYADMKENATYSKRTATLAALHEFIEKYPLVVAYAKHEAAVEQDI